MAARRFRFAASGIQTQLSPSETRSRTVVSDVPRFSDLNDLAAPYIPAKSKPTPPPDQISHFIRGSRELAGLPGEFQTVRRQFSGSLRDYSWAWVAKHDLGSS